VRLIVPFEYGTEEGLERDLPLPKPYVVSLSITITPPPPPSFAFHLPCVDFLLFVLYGGRELKLPSIPPVDTPEVGKDRARDLYPDPRRVVDEGR